MTSTHHVHPARHRSASVTAHRILDDFVDRNAIPGLSIAVVDRTGHLFSAAFGDRDLTTGAPATPDTSYLWFSLTKIVTATAAMRLVDEGRLALGDPVGDYVPALATGNPSPSVGQLLNHTAGFANPMPIRWVRPATSPEPPTSELLDRLLHKHGGPKRGTGGPAVYSNLGYLVLGAVIEAAAGQSFTDYVRATILKPLALDHTDFIHTHPELAATGYVKAPRALIPALTPALIPALKAALPRGVVGERVGRHLALNPFYVLGPSYGGLVGSVVDAGRFATAHLNDGVVGGTTILRPETARRMRDINAPGKKFDLGQGWFRKHEHSSSMPIHVEHLGAGGGFFNAMRLYPDLGIGFVVMTNTTRPFDHHGLFHQLIQLAWPSQSSQHRRGPVPQEQPKAVAAT